MQLFLSRTGTDMGNIDRELEKLICYALDRDVITAEDVMAVTTEQTTNKIFEMVNAIAEHNQRKALDLYYDLLTLKEPPMRIMFLITRQFQILLNVRDMAGRGTVSYTHLGAWRQCSRHQRKRLWTVKSRKEILKW